MKNAIIILLLLTNASIFVVLYFYTDIIPKGDAPEATPPPVATETSPEAVETTSETVAVVEPNPANVAITEYHPDREFYDLVSTDGRTIQAKFIELQGDQLVVLRKDIQKELRVPLVMLNEDSTKLTQSWYAYSRQQQAASVVGPKEPQPGFSMPVSLEELDELFQ